MKLKAIVICQAVHWCVLGDFNAVRSVEERRGSISSSHNHKLESEDFNWISDEMGLQDIPLLGRKFTWMRPNGQQMNRLDKILISEEWEMEWPCCIQEVLKGDFSDHCPILLRRSIVDWGPKPFWVLDCWFSDHRFKDFVEKTWSDIQVDGLGAFALEEKQKILRSHLKMWDSEVFGDLNRKKKDTIDKLNEL